MKTRRHINSFLLTGGLALLLLFPSVGLAAGGDRKPQSQTTFGDVLERQLPAPSYIVPNQVLLDLDKGVLHSMPTNIWMDGFFNPRPRYDWMVKHGADLNVHSSDVSTNLTLHLDDGRLAILGKDLTFGTIAAPDVTRELARTGIFQHLVVPKPENGLGVTLVFKTREGGLGAMQLLGFTAKPAPILKLRYKLVRQIQAAN